MSVTGGQASSSEADTGLQSLTSECASKRVGALSQ